MDIEEVDVRPMGGKGSEQDSDNPEAWEKETGKAGKGGAHIFSDGSLLESGSVGGGAFIVGAERRAVGVENGIGNVATVWGGEVAGMAGGLAKVRREKKVLILAD